MTPARPRVVLVSESYNGERVKSRTPQRVREETPVRRASPGPPKTDSSLSMPYPVTLVRDDADEGSWVATIDALPGCTARGVTPDETLERASAAVAEWVEAAKREGRDVPEPKSLHAHSGRLLLRMPQTLHAELSRAAEREKVSLNQFITDALAGALGWRAPRKTPVTRSVLPVEGVGGVEGSASGQASVTPAGSQRRSRFLSAVFVTNGVVVALAAVVAIIVLIVALLR